MSEPSTTRVVTFYEFVAIGDTQALRAAIEAICLKRQLVGTVLVAPEGVNGTLAGAAAQIERAAEALLGLEPLGRMRLKFSSARDGDVFLRLKVRTKPEIVAFGRPDVCPAERTGEHVDAARWHELLDDPDVTLIDARNTYEIAVGTFPGAINPQTKNFRDFPAFVAARLDPQLQPKIAMFCTGGIRCEKASAYLLQHGFEAVYQLDGGILGYLEDVPAESQRWQGDCFVFDQRVTVTDSLSQGEFVQCRACRRPLAADDMASGSYVEGVSCPYCITETSEARRQQFAERARQERLMTERGERHVGADIDRARRRKRE